MKLNVGIVTSRLFSGDGLFSLENEARFGISNYIFRRSGLKLYFCSGLKLDYDARYGVMLDFDARYGVKFELEGDF